jgi:DNA-binding XRE family transcriptional regulator
MTAEHDIIGRPSQCDACFAWVIPGSTHVCQPPHIDLRGLWRAALGARIAGRRNDLGMTQADLASALGVSRGSVANMERGAQDPPLSRVYMLAQALRCEPKDLI